MRDSHQLSERVARAKMKGMFFLLGGLLKLVAGKNRKIRKLIGEKDCIVQIRLRDRSWGQWFSFQKGKVKSRSGFHKAPDGDLVFDNARDAVKLMTPFPGRETRLQFIHMAKNFLTEAAGNDEALLHFSKITAEVLDQQYTRVGLPMPDGSTRYVNNTNAGPVFVYVKDGKILRITHIEFDETDAAPWTIKARGKRFTPPRKTTLTSYTSGIKSTIYSKDRLLYPMQRVDFDPHGERNPQNRGISGYKRISWEAAATIVADEIKRVKKEHGPGAIMNGSGSHHTWGNLGYWLSARRRFFNMIGCTYIDHNPDSWEGWFWGASHHWGNSIRNGAPDTYSTVEDLLKNAELIVFWSSDPEATSGVYGAQEGTVRRMWAKELGIPCVHIDPFYNHTAALMGGKWLAPRPATGNALALAIAYVWITEDLYDRWFVENRTTGFEAWRDYVLGKDDGIPKTPEWQEGESAVPAREVRALARQWGTCRTYLAAGGIQGFGSACRCATGVEWARSMVYLMAMQGIGKPGVNMGCLQQGTPVDTRFFFPGYAEGGLSGDLAGTGLMINMYQRMPQLMTVNTVKQSVPRLQIPQAILEGRTTGYPTDASTIRGQFFPIHYPSPGHSKVKLYWKYGGSHFGTMCQTNRYADMYRSEELEMVVNQSIWMEGEAQFADILLPACTNFERWDIGETANSGGYIQHSYTQWNHRVLTLQHKCIDPLGESKSDYAIFAMIAAKLGLGSYFTENCTELDWCKRLFDATDLPQVTSWREFLKKGYYVVPSPEENRRDPVSWNWYYEGRAKDVPEISPLPADYADTFRHGLGTQSGKLEFVSSSLSAYDPDDPERPVMSKYIPAWEGHHCDLYKKYPLFLITPHSRYSFHTMQDGKDGWLNDIEDHRVRVDGWYYWIVRLNPMDAKARGIVHGDLVEAYNDRGSVILYAYLTERIPAGTVHSYESSAVYAPIGEPGRSPDRGGCVNILTPSRPMIKKSHSTASNSCLIDVRKWEEA
ncbi:molybdopterin-dependent oxidoreductase [Desulfosarcina variabilis]|uniref:molybdopterin-dependent oxidoreductase n=1 Tax=Desulfosarcina variabilis TaxID=2300 RepID=UPI003AFA9739